MGRADDQSVRCRLCGERYRLITPTHLRSRHGWSGENPGLAYKARFAVASVWCRDSRRAMSASLSASHDRRGRLWTRARVLAGLRRLRSARFRDAEPRLYWSAQRIFGGWEAACRAAGIAPGAWPEWTRARVLTEIGKCRDVRWSAVPAPLYWAGQRLFGSWKAALRRAGRRTGPRWTRESVLLALRRRRGSLRSSAVRADDLPLYKAVYRLFRRWSNAISRV